MRVITLSAVVLLVAPGAFAQYVPPVDPKTILQSLDDLQNKQTKASTAQLRQAISDFTAAASSNEAAVGFYANAVQVTRFDGRTNESIAFDNWKKFALPGVDANGVRATLRYMVISLQRAAGATDEQIFPPLLAYAQDTQADLDTPAAPQASATPQVRGMGRRNRAEREQEMQDQGDEGGGGGDFGFGGGGEDIFNTPINTNVFAKWYNLGEQLGELKDWEMTPSDLDNMYEDFLLPYMRAHQDARIIDYWNDKIARERDRASNSAAAFNADAFNATRQPELLWHRAEDRIAIGNRDQGISEMYQIVKSYPSHPAEGKWIAELRNILAPPAAPTPVSTPPPVVAVVTPTPVATAPTPAPVAAPTGTPNLPTIITPASPAAAPVAGGS